MRRSLALVAMLSALPVIADESYRFHFCVTDGRTALLANPQFTQMKMPDAMLERAATERVMLFDRGEGARWYWLMASWPAKPVEQGFDSRGSSKNPDFGLTPNTDGTVKFRCGRERCQVRVTTPDAKVSSFDLKSDQSQNLPVDADFELTFTSPPDRR
jgi:hypothetical protein